MMHKVKKLSLRLLGAFELTGPSGNAIPIPLQCQQLIGFLVARQLTSDSQWVQCHELEFLYGKGSKTGVEQSVAATTRELKKALTKCGYETTLLEARLLQKHIRLELLDVDLEVLFATATATDPTLEDLHSAFAMFKLGTYYDGRATYKFVRDKIEEARWSIYEKFARAVVRMPKRPRDADIDIAYALLKDLISQQSRDAIPADLVRLRAELTAAKARWTEMDARPEDIPQGLARVDAELPSQNADLASPLDWQFPVHDSYHDEQVMYYLTQQQERIYLPQVLIISATEAPDQDAISIRLDPVTDHASSSLVRDGLAYYMHQRKRRGALLHDGQNARLTAWDPGTRTLTFQGSRYHEYCQTNLALDVRGPRGTLRDQLAVDGRLEPLDDSVLANSTGINSLVFTHDGYMVLQRRLANVIIRPGELCSGFSGTIDKEDIIIAGLRGGNLKGLPVLREGIEELGIIPEEAVAGNLFLGLTRELIRGGNPEFFYSYDLTITWNELRERTPKDKEGILFAIGLGTLGRSRLAARFHNQLEKSFDQLLVDIETEGNGPISIPLLTNLALWLQAHCPERCGLAYYDETLSRRC